MAELSENKFEQHSDLLLDQMRELNENTQETRRTIGSRISDEQGVSLTESLQSQFQDIVGSLNNLREGIFNRLSNLAGTFQDSFGQLFGGEVNLGDLGFELASQAVSGLVGALGGSIAGSISSAGAITVAGWVLGPVIAAIGGLKLGDWIRTKLENLGIVPESEISVWEDLIVEPSRKIIMGEWDKLFDDITLQPFIKRAINAAVPGIDPYAIGFKDPLVKQKLSSIDEQLKQGRTKAAQNKLTSVLDTLVNKGGFTRSEAAFKLAKKFDQVSVSKEDGQVGITTGIQPLSSKARGFREALIQKGFEDISSVNPVQLVDFTGIADIGAKAAARDSAPSVARIREAIRNVALKKGKKPSEVTFDEISRFGGILDDPNVSPEENAPLSREEINRRIDPGRFNRSDRLRRPSGLNILQFHRDTPGVMRTKSGTLQAFAPGDLFAAAQEPEDLVTQVAGLVSDSGGPEASQVAQATGQGIDVPDNSSKFDEMIDLLSNIKDTLDAGPDAENQNIVQNRRNQDPVIELMAKGVL